MVSGEAIFFIPEWCAAANSRAANLIQKEAKKCERQASPSRLAENCTAEDFSCYQMMICVQAISIA